VIDVLDEKRKKLLWSDYYLIRAQEDFDKIFKHVYEDHFIDKLFPEHEALISMDYFKDQITENTDEGAAAKWVFNPAKLREVFLSGIHEDDMKELEELVAEAESE